MIEFEKFARDFEIFAAATSQRAQIGLEVAAEYVQEQCKKVIGHEQPEWKPLAAATERIKEAGGYPLNAPLYRTGEYQKSIKKQVLPGEALIYSELPQAAYQEYGTKYHPPRPVFLLVLHRDEKFILGMIGVAVMAKSVVGRRLGTSFFQFEQPILPSEIKAKFFP
jgi:hypothetical protein